MLVINNNLKNLNTGFITNKMFNNTRASESFVYSKKFTRFDNISFGFVYGNAKYTNLYNIYGILPNGISEIICSFHFTSPDNSHNIKLYIKNTLGTAIFYTNSYYQTIHKYLNISFKDSLLVITDSSSVSIDCSKYEYISFSNNPTLKTSILNDVNLYQDEENWFIVDEKCIIVLNRINEDLYNNNSNILSKITTYNYFYNNILDISEYYNEEIYINKLNLNTKISYSNGITNIKSSLPIKINNSFLYNDTKEYFIIKIQQNFNLDSYLNTFLKGTDIINQITYTKFKIGSPTDDTADIKIDYINRIDMIDALNINIKVSNIIN